MPSIGQRPTKDLHTVLIAPIKFNEATFGSQRDLQQPFVSQTMDNSTKSFACSTEVSSFCVSFFKVPVITLDLFIILFIASKKCSAMDSSVCCFVFLLNLSRRNMTFITFVPAELILSVKQQYRTVLT